jgi:hypothetical protein
MIISHSKSHSLTQFVGTDKYRQIASFNRIKGTTQPTFKKNVADVKNSRIIKIVQ